ncbi:MAG: GIY-YIG nuclease family protein [Rhodospirillaceae bacterium]
MVPSKHSRLIPLRAFVYIIGTRTKAGWQTYVGWTYDLEQRLAAHNRGHGARSTRGRQWKLLYAEPYSDKASAMSREWYLKRDRKFRRLVLPA